MSESNADEQARQRLILHIGLPKSGSTYLQTVLGTNRLALREHGFVYPYVRQEGMFYAAVEMAGSPARWGLDHQEIAGTFAQLLKRGRRLGGSVMLSHEIFSAASPEQVAAMIDLVAEFEVHVVVTVRDLGRTLTAGWQEQVKNGNPRSFAEFSDRLLEQLPEDASQNPRGAASFWPAQNLLLVLDRWRAMAPPERIHVVMCPRSGAAPDLLWRRFAEAAGLPADVVDLTEVPTSNESLGIPQIALLRQVVSELDGRLEQPWFRRIAKRWFAQSLLSRIDAPKPVAPADVVDRLTGVSQWWIARLRDDGYQIHGDPSELVPSTPDMQTPHPDQASEVELVHGLPQVLAQMLLRHRDLSLRIDEVETDRDRLAAEVERLTLELARRHHWRNRLMAPFARTATRD